MTSLAENKNAAWTCDPYGILKYKLNFEKRLKSSDEQSFTGITNRYYFRIKIIVIIKSICKADVHHYDFCLLSKDVLTIALQSAKVNRENQKIQPLFEILKSG